MMKRMKTTILSAMVHFLTLDISHDFVCRNPATTSSQKRSSRIENVEDEDVPSRHSHSLGRRTEGEANIIADMDTYVADLKKPSPILQGVRDVIAVWAYLTVSSVQ